MNWLQPKNGHIIYEALSAIADNRLEMTSENTAKCTSTSRGKFYTIEYDPKSKSIMSNDNMAYYRDEVSYPMVAILLARGDIAFNFEILQHFKGIKWKDINQKNKNDFMKSVKEVLETLEENGIDIETIKLEVMQIFESVVKINLKKLGEKVMPPNAY